MPLQADKCIKIQDLPECYHKERLLILAAEPECTVNVVAVSESYVDWAAYIGFPALYAMNPNEKENYRYGCENVHDINGVRRNGDKLDEEAARQIFPEIAKTFRYRR